MIRDPDEHQTRSVEAGDIMKPDHAAARELATTLATVAVTTSLTRRNLGVCYLDLVNRHVKLLELAEAVLYKEDQILAKAALRAFIEGERNGL